MPHMIVLNNLVVTPQKLDLENAAEKHYNSEPRQGSQTVKGTTVHWPASELNTLPTEVDHGAHH